MIATHFYIAQLDKNQLYIFGSSMEEDHPNPSQSQMFEESQGLQAQPEKALALPVESSQDSSHAQAKKEAVLALAKLDVVSALERKMHFYHQQMQVDREFSSHRLNYYMCNMEEYFANKKIRHQLDQDYNLHSVISNNDEDRLRFKAIFLEMKKSKEYSPEKLGLSQRESRGIAAVMGMGIGDALGACTEFDHFSKNGLGKVITGFKDLLKLPSRHGTNSVWTDDASMGLCMADSLLLNDYRFDPKHIRYLFNLWLRHGLNNGGRSHSIGLGGNISISMYEFDRNQTDYTETGDRFNNGNGSLMRLAPVPVAYSSNLEEGIKYSANQSLTTHNGLQAEECSKLMANIIIQLINRDPAEDGKQTILRVCDNFKSPAESVEFLAKGLQESQDLYERCCQNGKFKMFNRKFQDRNWNWRSKDHTYSPTRYKQQPGYIGSYCMDALSMALHTVMMYDSFAEVVIKNADMGGDCDTVGSIAGQIAGALYGIDTRMLELYSQMEDFMSQRYEVFLKGYKLINKRGI